MTLLFNLSYNTVYGEEILLNIMSGDNASTVEQFKMSTQDGVSWSCSVNSLAKPGNVVNYFYSVAFKSQYVFKIRQCLFYALNCNA